MALTFAGTTIIGSRSATVGNGEGDWSLIAPSPPAGTLAYVELYNTGSLGVIKFGDANTRATAGAFEFGSQGTHRTRCYFTSLANAWARIAAIADLQRDATIGTLVFGSTQATNCFMEQFRHGPPRHCNLGNCSVAVDFDLFFVRMAG